MINLLIFEHKIVLLEIHLAFRVFVVFWSIACILNGKFVAVEEINRFRQNVL